MNRLPQVKRDDDDFIQLYEILGQKPLSNSHYLIDGNNLECRLNKRGFVTPEDDVELLRYLNLWIIHHTCVKKKRPLVSLFLDRGASKDKIFMAGGYWYWEYIDLKPSKIIKADDELLIFLEEHLQTNLDTTFIVVSDDKQHIVNQIQSSRIEYRKVADFIEVIIKADDWCRSNIFID